MCLPWNICHDIDGIGATDTNAQAAQAAAVRRMRVGADHHQAGERVVLQDNLMDDARARLPEADPVLLAGRRQEAVHLLVDGLGAGQILFAAHLRLDQVVAVDGRWDGNARQTGRNELQHGHLSGGIYSTASKHRLAYLWLIFIICVVGSTKFTLHRNAIGPQAQIRRSALNVLLLRVVQMGVEDFLGQG